MKINLFIALAFFSMVLCAQEDTFVVSEDVQVKQLTENTFLCTSYIHMERWGRVPGNGIFVKTDSGVVIIDTPWNNVLTKTLNHWIEEELLSKVVAVIVTHSHADCAGGLSFYNEKGIPAYGLELTKTFCVRDSLAFPANTFNDSKALKISDTHFHCYYPGAGHAEDNIVVWVEEEKVLFGGCLIKDIRARRLGNTAEADVEAWPVSVKNVQEKFMDAKIVVPGHGNPGGVELLQHTIDLLVRNNN